MLHRSVGIVSNVIFAGRFFFELTHVSVYSMSFCESERGEGDSETLHFELTCDYRARVEGVCVDAETGPAAGRPAQARGELPLVSPTAWAACGLLAPSPA